MKASLQVRLKMSPEQFRQLGDWALKLAQDMARQAEEPDGHYARLATPVALGLLKRIVVRTVDLPLYGPFKVVFVLRGAEAQLLLSSCVLDSYGEAYSNLTYMLRQEVETQVNRGWSGRMRVLLGTVSL